MAAPRKLKRLDPEKLWEYALRALAQRAHSAAELKLKLLRRAADPADVAATLAKLRDYGLADDRKFSEAFAAARLQNNGFGRLRVLRDLRSKRVPDTIAQSVVENTFAGTDEQELIEKFLSRKFRGKNLAQFLADPKNLAAAFRRLRVAGFGASACLSVLHRYSSQAEELSGNFEEDPS